jgi:hypothetical protein
MLTASAGRRRLIPRTATVAAGVSSSIAERSRCLPSNARSCCQLRRDVPAIPAARSRELRDLNEARSYVTLRSLRPRHEGVSSHLSPRCSLTAAALAGDDTAGAASPPSCLRWSREQISARDGPGSGYGPPPVVVESRLAGATSPSRERRFGRRVQAPAPACCIALCATRARREPE